MPRRSWELLIPPIISYWKESAIKKILTTLHFQKHDQDQWLYKPSKGHQQSKMLYILKNWHLEFSDAHFRAWQDDLLW